MSEQTTIDCGCVITWDRSGVASPSLRYCALHANGHNLLAACKLLGRYIPAVPSNVAEVRDRKLLEAALEPTTPQPNSDLQSQIQAWEARFVRMVEERDGLVRQLAACREACEGILTATDYTGTTHAVCVVSRHGLDRIKAALAPTQ